MAQIKRLDLRTMKDVGRETAIEGVVGDIDG